MDGASLMKGNCDEQHKRRVKEEIISNAMKNNAQQAVKHWDYDELHKRNEIKHTDGKI